MSKNKKRALIIIAVILLLLITIAVCYFLFRKTGEVLMENAIMLRSNWFCSSFLLSSTSTPGRIPVVALSSYCRSLVSFLVKRK